MLSFEQVVADYYREIRHCPEVGRDGRKSSKRSPLAELRAHYPGKEEDTKKEARRKLGERR